jgi:hypothetical protein
MPYQRKPDLRLDGGTKWLTSFLLVLPLLCSLGLSSFLETN